jgi:hypothetical protein
MTNDKNPTPPASADKLYVVTPCMGRLAHLKRSLPQLVRCGLRVVVVDYSCPDSCGAWVAANFRDSSPAVHVCPVPGKRRFSKPKAHNAGANFAAKLGAEHLCFIDCDTVVQAPQFGEWCREHAQRGRFHFFEPLKKKADLFGCLLVSVEDYAHAGGYDETFLDWGMEDLDMRLRLRLKADIPYDLIPERLATPIAHSDLARTRFYVEKETRRSSWRNLQRVRRNVRKWTGRDFYELPAGDLHPLAGYPRRGL